MSDLGPLTFNVPEPAVRPGGTPDFSSVGIPKAGSVSRPEVDADPASIRDLAYSIIRVLNRDGEAVGPWAGLLSDDELLEGLRHMMTLRAFDARMLMAQRQGKTSFYMQHMGEEAVSCAFRKALLPGDMNFPTYRQAGLLIAGDYPMVEMMYQIYSNELDPLKGRQLPIMYSSREHGFFSISGNLAHAVHPGGRLGDGLGDQGRHQDRRRLDRRRLDGESDFHAALVFASTYKAPVVLNIVNNQWAISTFQGIARGGSGTFAARGLGFGIAGAAGRRQRLSRGPCRGEVGGRAGTPQSRADAGRVCDLSRRRAFHFGRSLRPIGPRPNPMPGRSAIRCCG